MRTVVIFESMYGNTHVVAEALAAVARARGDAVVIPVATADAATVERADLVLVGGPTHAHGMTSSTSRKGAVTDTPARKGLEVEPGAEGPGLRDWFQKVGRAPGTFAAAFDTRLQGPPALTGRASRGIARRLRRHGFTEVAAPMSFLVDSTNHLLPGEEERARQWAGSVLDSLVADVAN